MSNFIKGLFRATTTALSTPEPTRKALQGGCKALHEAAINLERDKSQGHGDYQGRDNFEAVEVTKDTTLLQIGVGTGKWWVRNQDVKHWPQKTTAEIHAGLQIAGEPETQRNIIAFAKVKSTFVAGYGYAKENPQHGPGGEKQLLVHPKDVSTKLEIQEWGRLCSDTKLLCKSFEEGKEPEH